MTATAAVAVAVAAAAPTAADFFIDHKNSIVPEMEFDHWSLSLLVAKTIATCFCFPKWLGARHSLQRTRNNTICFCKNPIAAMSSSLDRCSRACVTWSMPTLGGAAAPFGLKTTKSERQRLL
jgi:hypothetical protein